MVFVAILGSLLLFSLTMVLCCCSCYERKKSNKKVRHMGFRLLQQTDREHMAPIIIESSSSDEELFTQHRPFKPSSGSVFRPIKPKGRVLGARLGQYYDDTSSSDELEDFSVGQSISPSSVGEGLAEGGRNIGPS